MLKYVANGTHLKKGSFETTVKQKKIWLCVLGKNISCYKNSLVLLIHYLFLYYSLLDCFIQILCTHINVCVFFEVHIILLYNICLVDTSEQKLLSYRQLQRRQVVLKMYRIQSIQVNQGESQDYTMMDWLNVTRGMPSQRHNKSLPRK